MNSVYQTFEFIIPQQTATLKFHTKIQTNPYQPKPISSISHNSPPKNMNRQQSCPTIHTHKYIISQIEALQKKKKQIRLLLKDQGRRLGRIQLIKEGLGQVREKGVKIAKEIKKLEGKVIKKEKEVVVNEEKLVQMERQKEKIEKEIEAKCEQMQRPEQYSQSQILMRLVQCQDEIDALLSQHSQTILPSPPLPPTPYTLRTSLIQFYLNHNFIPTSPTPHHQTCPIPSLLKTAKPPTTSRWKQYLFSSTQTIPQSHTLLQSEMGTEILDVFKGCSLFGLDVEEGDCKGSGDGVRGGGGLGEGGVGVGLNGGEYDMARLDYSGQSLTQLYQQQPQVHRLCQSNHQQLLQLISINQTTLSIPNYIAQNNLIQQFQSFITTQFNLNNHTSTQHQNQLQILLNNYINTLKQLQTFLTYKQDLQLYSPYQIFTSHLQQLLSYQSQLSVILSNINKQSLYLSNLIQQTQLLKDTLGQLQKQAEMNQMKKQQLERQLFTVQKRFVTFEEMKCMDLNQIDNAIQYLKQKRQANALSNAMTNGQLAKQNIQSQLKPSEPSQYPKTLTHVPSKAFTDSTHDTVTSIPCPDPTQNKTNYCLINSIDPNPQKHHKQNSFAQQLNRNYNQGTSIVMQHSEQFCLKQNIKPSPQQKNVSLDKKVQSDCIIKQKKGSKSCVKSNSMKNLQIRPEIKQKSKDEQYLTVVSPKCSVVKRKSSTTKPAIQLKKTGLKVSNWK